MKLDLAFNNVKPKHCTQGYYPGSPSMNSLDAIFGLIRSPETPLTVSMDAWRVQAYS